MRRLGGSSDSSVADAGVDKELEEYDGVANSENSGCRSARGDSGSIIRGDKGDGMASRGAGGPSAVYDPFRSSSPSCEPSVDGITPGNHLTPQPADNYKRCNQTVFVLMISTQWDLHVPPYVSCDAVCVFCAHHSYCVVVSRPLRQRNAIAFASLRLKQSV